MALEGLLAHGSRRIDEHLLNTWKRTQGHRSASRSIGWHAAPTAHLETFFAELGLESYPCAMRTG